MEVVWIIMSIIGLITTGVMLLLGLILIYIFIEDYIEKKQLHKVICLVVEKGKKTKVADHLEHNKWSYKGFYFQEEDYSDGNLYLTEEKLIIYKKRKSEKRLFYASFNIWQWRKIIKKLKDGKKCYY